MAGARTRVRIDLLGQPRITLLDDEVHVRVPVRAFPLLAFVVLAAEPPTRARVAETLWPDVPEAAARANLRRHMHALHRALNARGVVDDLIATVDGRCAIAPTFDAIVDVRLYEAYASDDRTRLLAPSLYRGDLLASYDGRWIAGERERLRLLHLRTLRRLAERARLDGDVATALTRYSDAREIEPWNEELVHAALLLQWESGDRIGALRSYRAFRDRLADDLQIEPGERLRAIGDALERGRAFRRPGSFPTELDLSTFVGRDTEIDGVARALDRHGCVVLTGPPGVGKTRLALRVARLLEPGFPDGVWFVDLRALSPGGDVETAIASVATSGSPAATRTPLRDVIVGRRMLLVLDNAEHVADSARAAVVRALGSSAALRIVVTSRVRLDIPGEIVWPVQPLEVPGAGVTLFIERANAANAAAPRLTASDPDVVTVCRRLDGLPLAIELAASRLGFMPFAALRAELGDRHATAIAAADGDVLSAAFERSYMLLGDAERAFLRAVATFRGSWSAAAAAAVAGIDERAAVAHAQRLIERSLVIAPHGAQLPPRYDMLTVLREYAVRRTGDAERAAFRLRHARYYGTTRRAAMNDADPFTVERATDHGAIARDFDDVRAALDVLIDERRDPELGAELVLAVGWYWVDNVPWDESRRRLETAAADAAPARAALIHVLASRLALRQGATADARREAEWALRVLPGDADGVQRAWILLARARAAWMAANLDVARADADEALRLCRTAGHAYGEARALSTAYLAHISAGDVPAARASAEGAAVLYGRLDARAELAEAHANLATCAYYAGDMADAALHNGIAFDLIASTENERLTAFIVHNLASTEWETKRFASAWQHIALAIRTAARIGYAPVTVRSIELVARWSATDDPALAARFAAAAEAGSVRYAAPFQHVERDDHDRLVRRLGAALDPETAAHAHACGAALSLDEAAAQAIAHAERRASGNTGSVLEAPALPLGN